MVVRTAVPDVVVTRLPFAVAGTDAEQRAAHAAAASVVARALQPARTVAFVTLGDPNMYSTFWHLADAVRARHPEVVVDTVPGIMAFQAVAARGGGPLLDGAEHLVLVGAASGVDVEALDAALGDPLAAVVVYKGGRHLPALAAKLERARRVDGAVVGELLGLDGERVSTVRDAGERPANYLATAVVPPVRDRSERTR
jgi:precorrin-2/cobalt-factor-2 C20-methyltransferase